MKGAFKKEKYVIMSKKNKKIPNTGKKHHVFWIALIVLVLLVAVGAVLTISRPKQKSKNTQLTSQQQSLLAKGESSQNSKTPQKQQVVKPTSTDYGFDVYPTSDSQQITDLKKRTDSKVKSIQAYIKQQSVGLPMTAGTIKAASKEDSNAAFQNGITFWRSKLTIDGKLQKVVVADIGSGAYEVFTAKPTDKNYSFTYSGSEKVQGVDNLDAISQDSQTQHYYDQDVSTK
ncbi:hypothetical protein IV71_GL000452 [Fructobacillus fructosus KCTC 3544]|nr:hypothetical protein IV71_GL000452 [Fructobacillus fructosus KCTC 3544]